MALTYSEPGALGTEAPGFRLPGTDGKSHTLDDFAGSKALVVAFICNHCPYVIAVKSRVIALAREYEKRGVRFVAISSNDVKAYPQDSLEKMKLEGYPFPYLFDESQEVARAYGAVCTPDFYVYDSSLKLRYRGRLDDSWKDEKAVKRRELSEALDKLLAGGEPEREQFPSMGCSLKWR